MMIRRGRLGVVACILTATFTLAGEGLEESGYCAPQGDRGTRGPNALWHPGPQMVTKPSRPSSRARPVLIDIRKYYNRPDPKVAAEELRQEAIRKGLDLDSIPSYPLSKPGTDAHLIHLPGAKIRPDGLVDDDLASKLDSMVSPGADEERLVCVLRIRRRLSLNEKIWLIREGVHHYGRVSQSAFFIRASVGTLREILGHEYVRWIGEYKAAYKYDQKLVERAKKLIVVSLDGDKEEHRNDLTRLGAKWGGRTEAFYVIDADSGMIPSLASLWWVREIDLFPQPVVPEPQIGVVFAYGVRVEPPYEFTGVGGDTLYLNGMPYWPIRGPRQPIDSPHLSPEMRAHLLEKATIKHAFSDSVWKAVKTMHEEGAAYEECLDAFAAAYEQSDLVQPGSVQKWERGINMVWADGQPVTKHLGFGEVKPFDRREYHEEIIEKFWKTVYAGGLVARGYAAGGIYRITSPRRAVPKTLALVERIARGEQLSREDVLGTPLHDKAFKTQVEEAARAPANKDEDSEE